MIRRHKAEYWPSVYLYLFAASQWKTVGGQGKLCLVMGQMDTEWAEKSGETYPLRTSPNFRRFLTHEQPPGAHLHHAIPSLSTSLTAITESHLAYSMSIEYICTAYRLTLCSGTPRAIWRMWTWSKYPLAACEGSTINMKTAQDTRGMAYRMEVALN